MTSKRLSLIFLSIFLLNGCINNQEKECSEYTENNCPGTCVVCPPCPECSSLSCNTQEYCESIGFNKSWYERIRENRETFCVSDSDCACGVHIESRVCFTGNKEYVDISDQCPDFCTGIAGNFEVRCVENTCKSVFSMD